MSSATSLLRSLLIYSICVPVAVFIGYVLAAPNPANYGTFAGVGAVLFFLSIPIILRWHHVWLVLLWNTTVVFFFIPGGPQLWMLVAGLSLAISILQYILNPRSKFLHAPEIARPLICLIVVVLVTAQLTGGFGLALLGSETTGGKRYAFLLAGIIGYFALTARRIPPRHAYLYVILFFLGTITQGFGELASVVSPSFYFLFMIFPVSSLDLIVHDPGVQTGLVSRLVGFSLFSTGVFCALLVRYEIKEIFSWRRIGLFFFFLFVVGLSLLGGYRTVLILFLLTFAILFYMEGLLRSRLMPILVLLGLLVAAAALPFANRLPNSMQRAISFLPVPIDPLVKIEAEQSTEWRLNMWRNVLPQIPQHLILGKGLGIKSTEFDQAALTRMRGVNQTESFELVSDYHNGPLSVIIPFGIFGSIAFLWFLAASLRALYQNYLFGHPRYTRINRFIFAFFAAKVIIFFVIFGNLYTDMASFTGLIGLSISLNGGVAKRALAARFAARMIPIKASLRPVRRPYAVPYPGRP